MANKKQKSRGLGRGLSALMADVETAQVPAQPAQGSSSAVTADVYVPIEKIHPNPEQPRRTFVEEDLEDLTRSVREKGIIQPLVVRAHPTKAGEYEIVAGERRWRASQRAQLHELPVVVRTFTDQEVLEIAIVENIQRADLNPVEEAFGYQQLMDRFGHTQEKLAETLGKSRSHIANLLRLLNLPSDVQQMLKDRKLSMGHARALVAAPNPSDLAKIVVSKDLSVRNTEKLAKKEKPASPMAPKPVRGEKDADTRALEGDLSAALKMFVKIDHKPGQEGGTLQIRYKDLEQLDQLCRMLGGD